MPVKILLYEDNDNLSNSITTLFQWNPDYVIAAALPNPRAILTDIQLLAPDIILMDIDMPILNGVDALRLIRQNGMTIPVIMLTVFEDDENILNAIQAGASGYLLKKNFDQIIPAILEVFSGGAPMSGSIARRVLQLFSIVKNNTAQVDTLLSPREKQILDLLVKGFSYKMIADQVEISIDTIRSHIKKIYRKLEVNSATEAIYRYTNQK